MFKFNENVLCLPQSVFNVTVNSHISLRVHVHVIFLHIITLINRKTSGSIICFIAEAK